MSTIDSTGFNQPHVCSRSAPSTPSRGPPPPGKDETLALGERKTRTTRPKGHDIGGNDSWCVDALIGDSTANLVSAFGQ